MNGSRKIEAALVLALAMFSYTAARANAQSAAGADASKKAAAEASPQHDESAEGEKRFQTHCSRCHVAPEDLNPRVVKAVVRQMRVRALLTDEDERLIVKYLAP